LNVIAQTVRPRFAAYHADTIDVAKSLPDASVHLSIFSPPFSSLFVYSASDRDLGNVRGDEEFFSHYRYLAAEQRRVMMPGRIVAVHCMDLPTSKSRDGYIGLKDFPGELIRIYQAAGFVFHSRFTIWKNPVTAMQRTKALGLLHKQLRKDSCMSRQGIPDYLLMFRTPGANPEPVSHTHETFPVDLWQRYASPVWATTNGKVDDEGFGVCADPSADGEDQGGIRQTEVLQYRQAREHDDEKHVCPLQLEVIRRAVRLWSNPGDIVWSPFMGIGSEGVVALQMGRRFIGAELKGSYYESAVRSLEAVDVGAVAA